jgi:hypothetical protein
LSENRKNLRFLITFVRNQRKLCIFCYFCLKRDKSLRLHKNKQSKRLDKITQIFSLANVIFTKFFVVNFFIFINEQSTRVDKKESHKELTES